MLTEKKNKLHSHPSLLPLRMALIAAAREAPALPFCMDVNEQLALQLITKMKAEYKRSHPFLNWHDIPSRQGCRESVHEMVFAHA